MSDITSYNFWPARVYWVERLRPWKLITFSIAMAFFFYGAMNFYISDWDIGVTIIMGTLTYCCAPWTTCVLYNAAKLRPRYWLLQIVTAIVLMLFVIDWVYWLYHTIMGNRMIRWENFIFSLPTYLFAGFLWMYRGTFRELVRDILAWMRPKF
ncbi:MAG TPA: hypothetical protein PLI09_23020 [Candidatus Hydrogenedentes bacterium]|nr:hypothetical protein [Candidatus Hydrogenedentota bacterium]